jgi:hypothetical protein
MTRLLGVVHMNPEKDPSTWDHTDVSTDLVRNVRAVLKCVSDQRPHTTLLSFFRSWTCMV